MRLEAWVVALIASLGGSELPLTKAVAGARAAMATRGLALEDECFIERKLYPNVDFYSGLIYQAMKFPVDMFPVLFAIEEKVMLANSVTLRSESIEEGKNLR